MPAELVHAWQLLTHAGATRLLRMAEAGDLEHESVAERTVYREVFQAFPPAPDCQVWLAPDIRVDYAYLAAGMVLEYLGEAAHAHSVDRDGTRTYALRRLGFDMFGITKSMLKDKPGLAATVHSTRREREQLILDGRLPRPAVPAQPDRLTPLRTLHALG
ncbi:hypothetical protein [Euzebya tangerina]|uniref:hypothetical protein n=1 Tax=Euzebya tangerina TaxID=591198 RepID=UPI0013C33C49|nr:hypothetical protein [Euzebya tangerina]